MEKDQATKTPMVYICGGNFFCSHPSRFVFAFLWLLQLVLTIVTLESLP